MTAIRFTLLFYGLVTIFISGGLFFKNKNRVNRSLTVFTLLLGLEMLDFLYATSVLRDIFPDFYGLYYFSIGLLYGPVLWFHFLFLIHDDRVIKGYDFLHFLPAIVLFYSFSDVLFMSGTDRIQYISDHFMDRIMPVNYIRAGHILLYGIICIRLIATNFYSLTLKHRIYASAICSIYFISAVEISWLTAFADNWRQFVIHYFISFTIVLIIGVILYKESVFLERITKKYLHSGLGQEEVDRIFKKLIQCLEEEKLYLNNDLKLKHIAHSIGENASYISQAVSVVSDNNFNDFINGYRIKFAREMLLDPKFHHWKIDAIGSEAGFNNKVTFYKSFNKVENMSPANFRKMNI